MDEEDDMVKGPEDWVALESCHNCVSQEGALTVCAGNGKVEILGEQCMLLESHTEPLFCMLAILDACHVEILELLRDMVLQTKKDNSDTPSNYRQHTNRSELVHASPPLTLPPQP